MSGLKVGVALSQVHLLNTIARPYWELYLQGNKSTEICRLVVSDLTLLFCDMLRSNSLRCDAVSRFSTLVVLASEVSKPNCHYISSPLRSKVSEITTQSQVVKFSFSTKRQTRYLWQTEGGLVSHVPLLYPSCCTSFAIEPKLMPTTLSNKIFPHG